VKEEVAKQEENTEEAPPRAAEKEESLEDSPPSAPQE